MQSGAGVLVAAEVVSDNSDHFDSFFPLALCEEKTKPFKKEAKKK